MKVIEALSFKVIDEKGSSGETRLVIRLKPSDVRSLRPLKGQVLEARIHKGFLVLEWRGKDGPKSPTQRPKVA